MKEYKQREGFTFYRSFRDAVNEATPAEQLTLYKAIADYALDQIEPDRSTLSAIGRVCWITIQPIIATGLKQYQNGCKGGAPKGNANAAKQPKNNPKTTHPIKDENEHENENENKNDIKEKNYKEKAPHKRGAFVPPSLETVKEYFSTLKSTDDNAEMFFDHFESNGWKVSGKTPMKDWQAAARNWVRRNSEFSNATLKTSSNETRRIYKDL